MKTIKGLILGSAATILAVGGAQAADLPVKAKAVEYVKVCSLYGAGFYYIPGTDTCVKIGGAIRIDTTINGNAYDTPFWQGSAGGAGAWNKDNFVSRSRINLTTDTRTATEYGVVRTYANLQFDFSQNRENIAGGFAEVDYAFIQFAGFTFGKAVSQFDPQWALSKPYVSSGFMAGSNNTTGIPQISYTASFGNGVSGTISLENATPYRNAGLYNAGLQLAAPFGGTGTTTSGYGTTANTFLGNSYGGNHIPDVVANLRLDQAWGSLHFGAAMHTITPGFYAGAYSAAGTGGFAAGNSGTGHPDDSYGFAVNGAVEFKNLPTGAGDSLKLEATYAKGAAKYAMAGGTTDSTGGGRFAKADANSIAFGYVLDGVYGLNGQIQQSEAWSVVGFYEHYWNPAWRTSLFGSYSHISYGDGGNAILAAAFDAGRLAGTGSNNGSLNGSTGNFDFGIAQIGTRTAWTPVKNLTFSAEFTYTRLEQQLGGTFSGSVSGRANPQGGYALQDQSIYNGSFQVLRSF
ncbi:porin [Tardiphaga alba]|uniref:Porin n=1 Tax=Tardiphaga alba TaxID=340268 RepID=A0ABX8A9A5_9BRAD|nr:porin [Tardiphaga alba]QUS40334.1 porin [Tardiphaga alba]